MNLTVAIFAPFPPTKNGIADYAFDIAVELINRGVDLIVVISDDAPEPKVSSVSITVMREAAYLCAGELHTNRVHFYQVGNNEDCIFVLRRMKERPGILVLHDCTLFDLIEVAGPIHPCLVDMFRTSVLLTHGIEGLTIADRSMASAYTRKALRMVVSGLAMPIIYADRVIVHSRYAAGIVNQESPSTQVDIIPHYTDIAKGARATRRSKARKKLGLNSTDFICVSAGLMTRAKCVDFTLQALSRSQLDIPNLKVFFVGGQSGLDIEALIGLGGKAEWASHIDYVEDEILIAYLDASDLLINLRNPTNGETSGILCRALGRGVCAIVHDHGWYAELPRESTFHIDVNADVFTFAAVVSFLYRKPLVRLRIEMEAQCFARRTMASATVADMYVSIIETEALRVRAKGDRARARNLEDFVSSRLLMLNDGDDALASHLAANSQAILDEIFRRSARSIMLRLPSLTALSRALACLVHDMRQFDLAVVVATIDIDVGCSVRDVTHCFGRYNLALFNEWLNVQIAPSAHHATVQTMRLVAPFIKTR